VGGIAEDFARELAKGMESLMREMGGEDLLNEGVDGDGGMDMGALFGKGGDLNEDVKGKDDFQTTIKQAMEKLKESESALKVAPDSSNPNADPVEALLAQLGAGDGESEEDLDGLLETMMSQLMNKELLYEPLKELHDKFPSYLEDHTELAAGEKQRYQSQYQSISKIIALFDDPAYKDDNPRVVELMTEMQSFGSPPPEIMGPMPSGFGFGADGTPQIPEGCIVA
jgi:peroxin-19